VLSDNLCSNGATAGHNEIVQIRSTPHAVSATVFRAPGFRFFFFSREEARIHIHIQGGHGEAKFWLEPEIELPENYGLRSGELSIILELVREHRDEITNAWNEHFGS
jgi:hypothetical protein